jgi:hypothetical protein
MAIQGIHKAEVKAIPMWRGRPGLASRWHLASGREQGQDALATLSCHQIELM